MPHTKYGCWHASGDTVARPVMEHPSALIVKYSNSPVIGARFRLTPRRLLIAWFGDPCVMCNRYTVREAELDDQQHFLALRERGASIAYSYVTSVDTVCWDKVKGSSSESFYEACGRALESLIYLRIARDLRAAPQREGVNS